MTNLLPLIILAVFISTCVFVVVAAFLYEQLTEKFLDRRFVTVPFAAMILSFGLWIAYEIITAVI